MKKILKISIVILALLVIIGSIFYCTNNESLPEGKEGSAADALAHKMLNAIHHEAYKKTNFLEWSFRGKHFYKWNKKENKVRITWDNNSVLLDTKQPEKSEVFIADKKTNNAETLKKATAFFNNDSFWLVAPHKVFEYGIKRRLVNYKGKDALLITYTSGGTTPGDSYLWILDKNGLPIAYKMWVSIIPTGGMEATWEGWITTSSGTKLPTTHTLPIGELNMGEVKGYN